MPGPPTTDSYGEYIVPVSPGWSSTATPTLAGYYFNPANRNYSGVSSNQPNQDYTAYVLMLNIRTDWLLNGTQGHFYNQILEAERGTAPYIWSVVSGSLPDGLTLNPNGMIRGTPGRPAKKANSRIFVTLKDLS